jgi:heme-degrading monooxygenase HmoA
MSRLRHDRSDLRSRTAAGLPDTYLDMAARLRPLLAQIDGFCRSNDSSLTQPGKLLSLSFWRDERLPPGARSKPTAARRGRRRALFKDYRLRIATVQRDYGLNERAQAPQDSRQVHDTPP